MLICLDIVLPPSYPKNEYFASVTVLQKKEEQEQERKKQPKWLVIGEWLNYDMLEYYATTKIII